MKVYHGSTKEINIPDVNHSKKYLDFGQGFYLTSFEDQARRWAFRKALRFGGNPTVNIYEMNEQIDECYDFKRRLGYNI